MPANLSWLHLDTADTPYLSPHEDPAADPVWTHQGAVAIRAVSYTVTVVGVGVASHTPGAVWTSLSAESLTPSVSPAGTSYLNFPEAEQP